LCRRSVFLFELVEQFLNERRHLKNVTADTIEWYETAFKAFRRTLNDDAPVITSALAFPDLQ